MGFSLLKCRALEQQRERRLLYWRKASSIGKVLDIWKDYLAGARISLRLPSKQE